MAGALEAREVPHQQLPAPDRPVDPQPRTVVDRSDRPPALPVLGQARGEVGVVMLDAHELHALALQRVSGGEVVRVQVVDHHLGLDREQRFEMGDPLAEGAQRLPVPQVADVVPDPCARALGQAERALELSAAREQRARRQRQGKARAARSRGSV